MDMRSYVPPLLDDRPQDEASEHVRGSARLWRRTVTEAVQRFVPTSSVVPCVWCWWEKDFYGASLKDLATGLDETVVVTASDEHLVQDAGRLEPLLAQILMGYEEVKQASEPKPKPGEISLNSS
jgi:hypothetical protein